MNVQPSGRVTIVQAVRNFGVGEGVGGVVENLESQFLSRGYPCERITLTSTGLTRRRSSNLVLDKLFQMRDVLWFSFAGAWAIKRRKRAGHCIVLTHGDPIAGDVFVNHGLLKKVMRDRHPGRFSLPRNPMHWFTLLRDEYRYGRRGPHRLVVSLTTLDDYFLGDLYPDIRTPRTVITNGIDLQRYSIPGMEERRVERARMGFSDDDFVAIFIGHEYDRKGLWPTIEALALLDNIHKLLVVGGSESAVASGRDFARVLGLADRVKFVGRQPDPKPFLTAADCLVLATAYEAAPLVMLEALASGLPIVATATGLATDLIAGPTTNGVVVGRDPESIGDGLRTVASSLSDADRDYVARSCRASVEHLAWELVADRYLKCIEGLARE